MSNICTVIKCERLVHSKEMCEMHYRRYMRTGFVGRYRPYRDARRSDKGTILDRFLVRVGPLDQGCWIWEAGKSAQGYGEMTIMGAVQLAHRVSYELFIGPIPSGLHIDHLCMTKECVNPFHLEPVTLRENIRRAQETHTHCNYGHLFTIRSDGKKKCYVCSRKRDKLRWPYRKMQRALTQ